ncbi:MAG: peptidoglycan-binding protein [Lachnospiraceae bacterium]|nr:peptidoglycan-binding protein [Lachnospiraceae bacterium]
MNEPENILERLTTDESGNTPIIGLPTPPLQYSLEPFSLQPYAEYVFQISAEGYEPVVISGAEILPDVTAIQEVTLDPAAAAPDTAETFVIGPHTLYGDYPPKIIEDEIQPLAETGEIVLSRVVIPEYVVVHDGVPSDRSAMDYYVPYRDYIKNVASSEIYATWPEAAIYANILAIQSFTLNRVYTEFYRNRGYTFTITSSTAYDHKWIPERNIYDTISEAVDNIFNNYLSRPDIRQPILTQYCDGKRVTCPGLMSQWGSKDLAEAGYSAIEILRYYYGSSIYINTSEEISGIPSSYPGSPLTVGSQGSKVRQMQEQLNTIADVYYVVPNIVADGIFGERTRAAVVAFQELFDLPANGIVDFATWYKISQIYVAVSRIAEYS